MYKSDAYIVATQNGPRVCVIDRHGLTQWPLLYSGLNDGDIRYQSPEHVPAITKRKARKLLYTLRNEPYYTPERGL